MSNDEHAARNRLGSAVALIGLSLAVCACSTRAAGTASTGAASTFRVHPTRRCCKDNLTPNPLSEWRGGVGTKYEYVEKGRFLTPPPAPPRIQGGETDFPISPRAWEMGLGGEGRVVRVQSPIVLTI